MSLSDESEFDLYIPRNKDGYSGTNVTSTLKFLKNVSLEEAKSALHDAIFEKMDYFKCDPVLFCKGVNDLHTRLKECDFDDEHEDIPSAEDFDEIEFYKEMSTRRGFCKFLKNIASFYASNMIFSLCKKYKKDSKKIHQLYTFFENVFQFTYHEKTIKKMESMMEEDEDDEDDDDDEEEDEEEDDDEDLFYITDILNLYKKFEVSPNVLAMIDKIKEFENENYETEEEDD